MGELMRKLDWSTVGMTDPALWPQSLQSVISICLNSPVVSAVYWGPDFRVLYNDAYGPALAARHPNALGRPLQQVWPEIYDILRPQLEQVATSGQGFAVDRQPLTMHRHGYPEETVWTYVFAPVRGESGDVAGIFVSATEITSRIAAEDALQELNETLERRVTVLAAERDQIWRLSRDPFVIADTDGVWVSANPAWTDILGWSQADLVGRTSQWIEHPEDQAKTRAEVEALAAGRVTRQFENRLRTTADDYRILSWNAVARDGLIYCVARDVTLERASQLELEDARDFSRLAMSAVGGVGVWTYEVDADRFRYDAAIADLYGLDPELGKDGVGRVAFLANVYPQDMRSLSETMDSGLVSPGDLEREYRIRAPDGSLRWVLSRGHTYFDQNGRPQRRTGIGVETTRLREVEAQLRQSQKMEAVGQLTGGLAHDFNNLLQGISGSLELLQSRINQGRFDAIDRYLSAALGASRRAAILTHRLLAFSRRQTLDAKPLNPNALLASLEELLRRTVGAGVDIEIVGYPGIWPILVDANQLENAVINLCVNARDAMPEGGRLTVETANRWVDDRSAKERDLPVGQYVSISVRDTGTGISKDAMVRIFDPFFTTKPLGEGTGLGLSMVYGFTKQSGGQVRVHSELGKGTTMFLYFPRYIGEADLKEVVKTGSDREADGDGKTVLIIDDEPTVRLMIADVLMEAGFKTIEASDGPAALAFLQANSQIDLLITDVGLPGGLSGRQIFDVARTARPDLPALFITGLAENTASGNGLSEAGTQLLMKPFTISALREKIYLLTTERPIS